MECYQASSIFGGDLKPDPREQPDDGVTGEPPNVMKMYVGNLPWSATTEELTEFFAQFGEVTDVHIPTDRDSGRPRGFAFVTMGSKSAMVDAIKGADGTELQGRELRVNEARPREERGGGGGGFRR